MRLYNFSWIIVFLLLVGGVSALDESISPVWVGDSLSFSGNYIDLFVDNGFGYQMFKDDIINQSFTATLHNAGPSQNVYVAYVFNDPLVSASVFRGGNDVSSLFTHDFHLNKHIYHLINPVSFVDGVPISWDLLYVPNEVDLSNKWDLYFYTGSTSECYRDDSCNYMVRFDPWWNSTFDNKQQINFTLTSNNNVLLNFSNTNINYSLIDVNGVGIRFVNEFENKSFNFNRSVWVYDGFSSFIIQNDNNFSIGSNTIYIYYNNNTFVDDVSVSLDSSSINVDNLVSHYSLDSDGSDGVSSNDLSVSGASSVAGQISNAYSFDGTNDYLSDTSFSWSQNTDYSLSMWVYADGSDLSTQALTILHSGVTSQVSMDVQITDISGDGSSDGIDMRLGRNDGSGNWVASSWTDGFPVNAWTHLVVVYSDTNNYMRAYVNNDTSSPFIDYTTTATFRTDGDNIYFGDWGDASRPFTGKLDEISFWNESLTTTKINDLYNNEYSGFAYPWSSFDVVDFNISTIFFNNQPPSLSANYSFEPVSVVDDVVVDFNVSDVDGDDVNVSIDWYVNYSLVSSDWSVVGNSSFSNFSLSNSYFGVGDNVSAFLVPTDNNSNVGDSINLSLITIVGSPVDGVSGLSVVSYSKDWVFINWSNPVDSSFNSTEGRVNGSLVFNLNVSEYNFTGLSPGNSYLFSFYTWSQSGVRNNTAVSVVQSTSSNNGPVINSYSPSSLSPSISENSSTLFNVSASDDDGVVWYRWLLDGVVKVYTQAYDFVTGFTSSGSYNVTVIVNDTYNDSASLSWSVVVSDDFPIPGDPVVYLSASDYKYSIPVKCFSDGADYLSTYYTLDYRVNGGSWVNVLFNSSVCDYSLDISAYDYGTNFSFRSFASSLSGVSNYTYSSNVSKVDKDLFYLFDDSSVPFKNSFVPYDLGFVADFNNSVGLWINYGVVDCNDDGVFDYFFDYNETGINPVKVTQSFTCVNYKGSVKHTIGVIFASNNVTPDWSVVGCNALVSDDYCMLTKDYEVLIK